MRVAIVGTGVSGLVTAHLLHREHEITVFEANAYAGGHVNTIDVELEDGRWAVDTGFIVYNELNYPHFTRLLEQLGVATQPSTMSFSVRSDQAGLEYNGSTVRQLFAQRRNLVRPSFYRMLVDVLRFNRAAPTAVRNGAADLTLGEYVETAGYSAPFVDHYLLPMGSAIWSVPRTKVLDMPAGFFVRFFENHGMLTVNDRPEWRVITGGSRRYVEKLTAGFRDRIRLRHRVRQVRRFTEWVEVDGERFDQVVLACHSDQALGMLADPTPVEREVLGAMPYEANRMVLHMDTSMLPRRRSAWAAWNYQVAGPADQPAAVTYNMNMLQSLAAPRTFCVTLNRHDGIDADHVLYETWYHHPLYTMEAVAAQRRHGEISGVDRTHYAGAYWGNGFHEDGVRSALAVCAKLGVTP